MFGTERKELIISELIDYMQSVKRPVKLNELSKHVNISSDDKDYDFLKELLSELELNGVIEKMTRRRYQLNGNGSGSLRGYLHWGARKSYVISTEEDAVKVNVRQKYCENALHGDLVDINVVTDKKGKLWGRVINVVERSQEEIKGNIEEDLDGFYFVPNSSNYPFDFFVPNDKLNGAKDGDIAFAKVIDWDDPLKNPTAEIVKRLGSNFDNKSKYDAIVHEFGLPAIFPDTVSV